MDATLYLYGVCPASAVPAQDRAKWMEVHGVPPTRPKEVPTVVLPVLEWDRLGVELSEDGRPIASPRHESYLRKAWLYHYVETGEEWLLIPTNIAIDAIEQSNDEQKRELEACYAENEKIEQENLEDHTAVTKWIAKPVAERAAYSPDQIPSYRNCVNSVRDHMSWIHDRDAAIQETTEWKQQASRRTLLAWATEYAKDKGNLIALERIADGSIPSSEIKRWIKDDAHSKIVVWARDLRCVDTTNDGGMIGKELDRYGEEIWKLKRNLDSIDKSGWTVFTKVVRVSYENNKDNPYTRIELEAEVTHNVTGESFMFYLAPDTTYKNQ